MQISYVLNDNAVLDEIGKRLAAHRLAQNLSQKELAAQAGVSLSTLTRLEDGNSVGTSNFIRVLRGLGLLDNMEAMLPQPETSPVEMMKRQGKMRQRASRRKQKETPSRQWSWGDEE